MELANAVGDVPAPAGVLAGDAPPLLAGAGCVCAADCPNTIVPGTEPCGKTVDTGTRAEDAMLLAALATDVTKEPKRGAVGSGSAKTTVAGPLDGKIVVTTVTVPAGPVLAVLPGLVDVTLTKGCAKMIVPGVVP